MLLFLVVAILNFIRYHDYNTKYIYPVFYVFVEIILRNTQRNGLPKRPHFKMVAALSLHAGQKLNGSGRLKASSLFLKLVGVVSSTSSVLGLYNNCWHTSS